MPEGRIILESFSPLFQQAQDFLVTIAEPISRPRHMHEYKLTEYSLYAAVSVGLAPSSIIIVLDKLCKFDLPDQVKEFIQKHTRSYGKIKLVLRRNEYFIESKDEQILQQLLQDECIRNARTQQVQQTRYFPEGVKMDLFELFEDSQAPEILPQEIFVNTQEDEEPEYISSFMIAKESVNQVKKRCSELGFPILEEYEFNDCQLKPLKMDLKPFTKLRPYQTKSLGKMFGNGRARSGIIVLPCGSGKTLVGVTAACTIKKSCLILCTNNVSVEQWAREFRHWSTLDSIAKFTSGYRETFQEEGVLISTYTMLTFSGKRAYDAQKVMDFITSREWGLLLLDEVHVVPADMFRKVLTIVGAHCKLGLTATLLREDDKIDSLNYLIGPKLYEANWMELANKGFIAQVSCCHVWCEMPKEFFREYLKTNSRKRELLYMVNPFKIQACDYLVQMHEQMGDKVIVFSDNVFCLKLYASKIDRPFIYGGTSQAERMRILSQFRYNPALNTIFISKVGDTSIDLPEANVLIQISSQYGSRRQEAQRLGRILRSKHSGTQAHFYSLVSKDTEEMFFAGKRQQFLVDQGYSFRIITQLQGLSSSLYQTLTERIELLNTALLSTEKDWEEDEEEEEEEEEVMFERTTTTMSSLSGGDTMAYLEFTRT